MRISVIEGHLTATDKRNIKAILEQRQPSYGEPVNAKVRNTTYELSSQGNPLYVYIRKGDYGVHTIGAEPSWNYFKSVIHLKDYPQNKTDSNELF